jgi:TrmH family RNA methyltransferase
MHPVITSHQNPKIKNVLALEKSRERQKQSSFIIEGLREVSLAVTAGYVLKSVFFCPAIASSEAILKVVKDEHLLIPVEKSVFEKMAYREGTEGIIAIATQKTHVLDRLTLTQNPLLIILESVEKPGNLGAILRTADASRSDAVIICDPRTDFYNPNVIRSSVGCLFTTQTAAATSDETILWLKQRQIQILVTDLEAAVVYHEVDLTKPTAIILGTESTGISAGWKQDADKRIVIPMRGTIDSMNVSNAAAVIVFESLRQRGLA